MKNTDYPYINDSPVDLSGREGAPRLRDFTVAIGHGNFIMIQAETAQDASDIARAQGHRVMWAQVDSTIRQTLINHLANHSVEKEEQP